MSVIYIDQARCTGCGTCLGLCPRGAIALENGVAMIATNLCDECRDCLDECPQAAIVLVEPVPANATQVQPVPTPSALETTPDAWPSVLDRGWAPAAQAALLWAGREILPRLADLALDWIDQRQNRPPTERSAVGETARSGRISDRADQAGSGRRRRARRRQQRQGR